MTCVCCVHVHLRVQVWPSKHAGSFEHLNMHTISGLPGCSRQMPVNMCCKVELRWQGALVACALTNP
jgi:hypothetical protein